jgi:hypothetical protein
MKILQSTLVMITTLANLSVAALAQEPDKTPVKTSSQAPSGVDPGTAPPSNPPPPPPAVLPKPPSDQPQGSSQQKPVEEGQWVYTEQYGWVWMPYGDKYTHLPPDGSTPNMYVYYPDGGWCWVVAPWLWGWGPMPYFGLWGPRYYGWFGIGLGRWYGFGGRYRSYGWGGRAYWGGGRWNGVSRSYGGFRGGGFHGEGFRGGGGFSRGLGSGGHR